MFYFPFYPVKANLHLFKTEEGGRENGIGDMYRPDHLLSDDGVLTMGPVFLLNDKKEMEIGDTQEVEVDFLVSLNSKDKLLKLKAGDKWKVYEGKRCVGECEMIEPLMSEEDFNKLFPVVTF
ncbi:MAG TPA: hypothetical protein DFH96_08530 [Bacteroidetes bacterium]|jgi:translation elongation factor EF-Tu-like GTPase|nr:hypothetical protein [Bacteroidota bacterium]